MGDYGPYSVHPVAALFPLIEGEEFDELVADIRERGLQEPIVLTHDSTVLADGRNRYRGCIEARVDPNFTTLPEAFTEEDIEAWILASNLKRRHLDVGQRVAIGIDLERHYAEVLKERERQRKITGGETTPQSSGESSPRRDGEAARQAAAAVGMSHDSISRGKVVEEFRPDLFEQMRVGVISLNAAYDEAREKKRQRDAAEPKPKSTPEIITLRTHEGVEVPYPKPKAKATFNPTNELISWAMWSWNPVTGCLHGCPYCYARAISEPPDAVFPAGFTPLFHHERLDAPANSKVPAEAAQDPRYKRVFVCSMADLYGKWVPQDWIRQVHASCTANPQWDYLLLTKFPSRYVKLDLPPTAWVGTSVDSQRRVNIAEDAFRKIEGVRVKWLSLEPLLEPLAFSDLSMFDWVVIGAQTATTQPSGHVPAFAPPIEWVASLIDQARTAGCAVYLKPNLLGKISSKSPGMQLPQEVPDVRGVTNVV
jgi:protein gp37